MIGRLLFFYVGMDFISVSELSCEKNGRVLAEAHRGTLRPRIPRLQLAEHVRVRGEHSHSPASIAAIGDEGLGSNTVSEGGETQCPERRAAVASDA